MRVQPIEKSVGLPGAERNHTMMRWQRAAAFTPKGQEEPAAHSNVTEDKCQTILSSRAAVAMNAARRFLDKIPFTRPAAVRTQCARQPI
jgi:hypothetical protein